MPWCICRTYTQPSNTAHALKDAALNMHTWPDQPIVLCIHATDYSRQACLVAVLMWASIAWHKKLGFDTLQHIGQTGD